MPKVGILHPNMEKYRYILEHQYELAEIYKKNRAKYKLAKSREEKRRYTESLKIKSNVKLNGSNYVPGIS